MSTNCLKPTTSSIRWGIIGCGKVTEVKSGPAYQKTNDFKLDAVMRRNLARAKDYADRHGVDKYTDNANAIINDDNIDAIYIATPPDSHLHYALQVAEAGKICCIEKPLSPTYQESLSIVNAFEAKNLPLFVAYYRRSLPRFNKVKTLLSANEIGKIRHVSWHLSKPANDLDLSGDYNWRTDKNIALGGYFDDLASHGLDLFAYLLGDYQQVKGIALNQQALYSAFDAVSACWQHKNGITGTGSWNFGGNARHDHVTIYGSEGEISFSVFDDRAITLKKAATSQEIYIHNPENIQLFHVNNMREQLVNNRPHPSTGITALHTSWVMEEILRN
ncbi:Gfo/Idh/MocA family protein [Colwelliaceae bacterium 6441]